MLEIPRTSNTGITTVIPVIASFDTDGHIVPLYIRINGESYKVESSWLRPSFCNPTFQCKINDNGILKPLILTYHTKEYAWSIPYKLD